MTTLTDLMDHCRAVFAARWQYVYGAKGKILTREQIRVLQNRYGKKNVYDSDFNKAGQICCDCSGLISNMTRIERNSQEYFDTALIKKILMRGTQV